MNPLENSQANFFELIKQCRLKGLTESQILQISQLSSKGMNRYCGMGYRGQTKANPTKDAWIVPYTAFKRLYDFIFTNS